MKRNTLFSLLIALGAALILTSGILMVGRAQAQQPEPQGSGISGAGGTLSYQAGVGSGFTYQGYLVKNNTPVSDTCDFQFSLHDAASSGSQVGSTQTKTGVSVSEGYFTVTDLDFGAAAFQGDARYLQIAVRCPTGGGSYVALSGRVALNAVPYAQTLRPGAKVYGSATGTDLGDAVLNVSNSDTSEGRAAIIGASGDAAVFSYPLDEIGVRGDAASGIGVAGISDYHYGVYGLSSSGTGVYGTSNGYGVQGTSYGDFSGVGVLGLGVFTATGVEGSSDSGYGVYGVSNGDAGAGVYGASYSLSGYGVYSNGDAHVEGDLTWQAKTSYIAVPAAAFRPATSGYNFYNEGYYLANLDGNSDNYRAPLQLPHGATVTGLTFYWFDSSLSEDGFCTMYRDDNAGTGGNAMAGIQTSGSGGNGSDSAASIDYAGVDNSQYMYHLSLYLPDSDVGLYSVVIEYTTTGPH